jgi:hypothetical protein
VELQALVDHLLLHVGDPPLGHRCGLGIERTRNQLLDAPATTIEAVLGRKDTSAPAIVSVTPGASVRQAIRLNMLPRLEVIHTSGEQEGQIYIPSLNGVLLVGCLFTVLLFPTSTELASAYGIAVTAGMLITTILFAVVARMYWRWRKRWLRNEKSSS